MVRGQAVDGQELRALCVRSVPVHVGTLGAIRFHFHVRVIRGFHASTFQLPHYHHEVTVPTFLALELLVMIMTTSLMA